MNKHLHFLSLLWLSMLMAFMTACSDDKNITDPAPEPEPPVEGQWTALTASPDTWDETKRADISYQLLVYYLRRQRRRRIWRPEWRHPKAGLSQPTRRAKPSGSLPSTPVCLITDMTSQTTPKSIRSSAQKATSTVWLQKPTTEASRFIWTT